MGKLCLKCNYERTLQDDPNIPESTCPRCGAVYVKVEYAIRRNSNSEAYLLDEDKIKKIKEIALLEKTKLVERIPFEKEPNNKVFRRMGLFMLVLLLILSTQNEISVGLFRPNWRNIQPPNDTDFNTRISYANNSAGYSNNYFSDIDLPKFKKIFTGQIPIGPYRFAFWFKTNNSSIDRVQLNRLQINYSTGEITSLPLELVSKLKPYRPAPASRNDPDHHYKYIAEFYNIYQPLKLQNFILRINYTVYFDNRQQKRVGEAELQATKIPKNFGNGFISRRAVHAYFPFASKILQKMFYMP